MRFDSYFKAVSYATVVAGALTLYVCGGFGIGLGIGFLGVLIYAWYSEGKRWQLPERIALVVVVLSIPLFYFDWKLQAAVGGEDEKIGVAALTHLILFLSAVKLIQVKADRDWIFLYLIAFFEVLLGAGLSINPAFLLCLAIYLMCALSTIIAFEIRKAGRDALPGETRLIFPADSSRGRWAEKNVSSVSEAKRLPWITATLLALIFCLAMPLFFAAPRLSGSAFTRAGGGLAGFVGFSDSVTLGDIGRIQQSDRLVMRVRVDGLGDNSVRSFKWRGVALDTFTGRGWKNSRLGSPQILFGEDRGFFRLGTTEALPKLASEVFFLEPLDTPVLFAAPRAVAVSGGLPFLKVDGEGGLSSRPHDGSRITYKVYSDTSTPDADVLRRDQTPYSDDYARYLLLPSTTDKRIYSLASEIATRSHSTNRYDIAVAIESYLRDPEHYRYSLDLKAGGRDPLADFLFRVREGHCEYFASSLAVLLRTQGIATRVVNGFQTGKYNDAANIYTVTQKDAHSWVEVYFPATNSWVTFDPTPANAVENASAAGISSGLGKYAEALQILWTEYFVGYGKQEQRSLAMTLRNELSDTRTSLGGFSSRLATAVIEWFSATDSEGKASPRAYRLLPLVLAAMLIALLVAALFRLRKVGWRRFFVRSAHSTSRQTVVEFYMKMVRLFENRGVTRADGQTPLEFAAETGRSEAVMLTKAYNNVRFGGRQLSRSESQQIETWLTTLAED